MNFANRRRAKLNISSTSNFIDSSGAMAMGQAKDLFVCGSDKDYALRVSRGLKFIGLLSEGSGDVSNPRLTVTT